MCTRQNMKTYEATPTWKLALLKALEDESKSFVAASFFASLRELIIVANRESSPPVRYAAASSKSRLSTLKYELASLSSARLQEHAREHR